MMANGNENAGTSTSDSPKESIDIVSSKQLIRGTPLHEKMVLIMYQLSGNSSKTEAFRKQLLMFWTQHGERVRENNMIDTWEKADSIAVNGISITFLLPERKE